MICDYCGQDVIKVTYRPHDLTHGRCQDCYYLGEEVNTSRAPGVIPDDIPGGLEVSHGLCNPDGSPRKFYSKSEIRTAAYESGWTIHGETPNPNPRIVEQRRQEREARRR